MDNSSNSIIVVGGGAAGMMAAYSAAVAGASVTIFERNSYCGKKLRITGKGRCNLTNDCDLAEFLKNVPTNPRFLYSALSRFSTEDTKALFTSLGVELKVERGRRVFPVSDRAEDVVNAMVRACRDAGVRVINQRVKALMIQQGRCVGVLTENKEEHRGDAVIVATGGRSYPGTGSDGDGYALARSVGHTVTPILPSLVPMVSDSRICPALQGLSLRNVAISIINRETQSRVFSDFGEMMFTHFGVTGPTILSASAHIPDISSGKYLLSIDLKPALDDKTLDARILSDLRRFSGKDFINSLGDLLPKKMIPVIVSLCEIDPHKKVDLITREERKRLFSLLRGLQIPLKRFRPIAEAIITKGGVSVSEIDPKTMASRLCPGLYFAGEVIDVDAYTGGFNLQIAFSTGALAGESAAWQA